MTATPVGWLLLAIVALFFLHACWRLISSRNGSAIACSLAAYLALAVLLDCHEEPVSVAPLLLPFVYGYAWLGIAAVMWAAANMKVERRALSFPGQDPRLAALFASQLALHIGVLAFSPWLAWRPLAAYIMAPPLLAAASYAAYRVMLMVMRRRETCGAPWPAWATLCVTLPLALVWLEHWLAPWLLDFT
ncbi:hypothetical protein [Chromobacterium sp. IIBBL 290-4]|uniref:hypothetical protein n=1 Tax=Chromobacterium sp. IIBBL 290-4 TaxID=2953890 RepID=UPI0020B6AE08|nr:hypothetical protein [Chromobacterium sp. IIBBL 290-4]UTH73234.1 hypothetical protein NKT35_17095 [Chromobacterium sp. IIBBL 290-4]